MEIVEPGIPKVICQLQKEGKAIMGFTTQGLTLANRTALQLLQHGIDLSKTAPLRMDHYFRVDNQGMLFRNGILFTSGVHKGAALTHLLEALSFKPDKIVFINDKEEYLHEIAKVPAERGIPFVGLRYGYSDFRKERFCPHTADHQFAPFARILSDEEAQRSLKDKTA
jgi:hypothetical protein